MADKAAKSDEAGRDVVDLQDNERWQERLADARARRAQTLKEAGRDDGTSRKPRKPWEEETAVDFQTAVEAPTERKNKFDFLDRVEVLKRVTGRETDLDDLEPRPGKNWYPQAGEMPVEPNPREAAPKGTLPSPPSEGEDTALVHAPVDNIFDDPSFDDDDSEPVISLLLDISEPLPSSSLSRPWLQHEDEFEDGDFPSSPAAVQSRVTGDKARKTRFLGLPGWIGLVILILTAIAVGPLSAYAPWQTRATGPAPPFFGVQPALGITASFVEVPPATSAIDWRPASKIAPNGPLSVDRSNPPEYVRTLNPNEALPQYGAASFGVDMPTPAFVIPILSKSSPVAPRLTLSMFERISGDPTRLVVLPPALASVSVDAISPVSRPDVMTPNR